MRLLNQKQTNLKAKAGNAPRPTIAQRNKLNDLQTEEYRRSLMLNELKNSTIPAQNHQGLSESIDNENSKTYSVRSTNKSKKLMEISGQISLGVLIQKNSNSNRMDKYELNKSYHEQLERQIQERNRLKDKGNYDKISNIIDKRVFDRNPHDTPINNANMKTELEMAREVKRDSLRNSVDRKRYGGGKDLRISNIAYHNVVPPLSYSEVIDSRPYHEKRFHVQRNWLESVMAGSYLNKDVVRPEMENSELYESIKKNYGNHASVYNIITGV